MNLCCGHGWCISHFCHKSFKWKFPKVSKHQPALVVRAVSDQLGGTGLGLSMDGPAGVLPVPGRACPCSFHGRYSVVLFNSLWLHAGADKGRGETQQGSPKAAQCKALIHQISCLISMEHRLGGRAGLGLGAAQEAWGDLSCSRWSRAELSRPKALRVCKVPSKPAFYPWIIPLHS